MKKLILSLMFVFSFSTVFAAINKNLVENSDGTVSITNVDKDGSAIKFNKTVDNFQNVTVIDAKKVKNQKFIKASLEDFDKKEVMISFSCDVKGSLVHQVQVRGSGTEVGFSLGRRLSRLAHRMLRHLREESGRISRPPLRRHRQCVPPSHQ